MGMLTNEQLVNAVIVNMSSWDWDINTKFSLTKEEAEAVLEVLRKSKPDFD